ncbi:MAG TPA: glucose-6-phosphate isomerase [Terriglobia bacterium]|nr:glucose-6-phosphate isomerase [Terriglobia bacterium]
MVKLIMMLELDYTNVLEQTVHNHGIPKIAFDKAAESSRHIVDGVQRAHASGKLGFGDLPNNNEAVRAVVDFARSHSQPNVLLLGIGGSALGPAALDAALDRPNSGKRLIVLDNIDPDFIHDSLDLIVPQDTIVNVIAKSGVTAETMATFAVVRKWMVDAIGEAKARERFVVTTDPAKGDLLAIARQERYPAFEIPPNVGGRFSVLTPVGTLPAALLGFNVDGLMDGARKGAEQSRKSFFENPALVAAFIQFVLERERGKRILVLFPYSQPLWKFAFWFKQLWGESLGKKIDRRGNEVYYGQTPTAALGVTDQHSQLQLFIEGPNDKVFLFWSVKEFRNAVPIDHPFSQFESMGYLQHKTMADLFQAEKAATEIALTQAGRPNATVTVDRINEESLGHLIMFSQYFTAYAGEFYDIDAFDQPGVEYGKKLTFAMMGRSGFAEYDKKIRETRDRARAIIR